jgi:hypothetical protein
MADVIVATSTSYNKERIRPYRMNAHIVGEFNRERWMRACGTCDDDILKASVKRN